MTANTFRMVPSEQAGYGPGRFVVQGYSRGIRTWFDIGDPLSRPDALERLRERRSGVRNAPTCDHCQTELSRDTNGYYVGSDSTSDCPESDAGHTVNGDVR